VKISLRTCSKSRFGELNIFDLIQDAKIFKNKNLVGKPDFTSGETTMGALFYQRLPIKVLIHFLRKTLTVLLLIFVNFFCFTLFCIQDIAASNPSIIRDAEIEKFIHTIADPIFDKAGLDKQQIKIFVVDDNSINAFVAGGQNLFINTGLIQKFKTPDALVGVIAHETGHIAAGHLVRSYEKGSALEGQMALAYALGIAAIAAGSPAAGTAMIMGSSQIAERIFLKFTRSQEEAADSLAIQYLDKLHYPADGLVKLLEGFDFELIGIRQKVDEYQITHPVSRKRIDLIKAKTANQNFSLETSYQKTNQKLQKQMSRVLAKLEGFLGDPNKTLEKYRFDESENGLYLKSIVNFRLANFSDAQKLLELVIKKTPKDGFLYELSGDFFANSGNFSEAAISYQKAIKLLDSKSAAISRINFASNLISKVESDQQLLNLAINQLDEAKKFEDENPILFKLLSKAYEKIGDEGKSILALAEFNYLINETEKCQKLAKEAQEKLKETDKSEKLRAKDLIELTKEGKQG